MTEENNGDSELKPEAEEECKPSQAVDVAAGGLADAVAEKQSVSTADKIKFAGLVVFVILIIICGVMLVPYIQQLNTPEGRAELVADIQDAGVWGVLISLGMQFLQIVVAFIPGELVQLVIGLLYGTIFGSLIVTLGAVLSSAFVFYVVRKLGAPFVQAMIGKSDSKRMRFLQETKQLDTVVFVLYLIPGLPKDVFNYVLPLTKIQPSSFLVLSTIGRLPGIIASSYIGSSFWQGNYVGMVIVAVLIGGLGLVGIVFNQQILAQVHKITARFSKGDNSELESDASPDDQPGDQPGDQPSDNPSE